MKIIISMVIVMMSLNGFACDVCGGPSGLSSQGFLPNQQFHFVGIVSNYSQYQSQRNILLSDEKEYSHETFFKSALIGRWQATERIAILGSIPFAYNQQSRGDQLLTETGIGDISVMINTVVLSKNDSIKAHFLRLGAGLKGPTGQYSHVALETNNLFPGTGAFDFLASTNYMFRKSKWGLIQENQTRIPTANSVDYKYGLTVNASLYGFYSKSFQNSKELMPFIGASLQWKDVDRINNIPVAQQFNGGTIITADAGVQAVLPSWMIHLKYSHPFIQQLSNNDVLMTVGNIELGVRYLIKKN